MKRRINKQAILMCMFKMNKNDFNMQKLDMYSYKITFYKPKDARNNVDLLEKYYDLEYTNTTSYPDIFSVNYIVKQIQNL